MNPHLAHPQHPANQTGLAEPGRNTIYWTHPREPPVPTGAGSLIGNDSPYNLGYRQPPTPSLIGNDSPYTLGLRQPSWWGRWWTQRKPPISV